MIIRMHRLTKLLSVSQSRKMHAGLLVCLCLLGAAVAEVEDEQPAIVISDYGDFWYFTDAWREEYDEDQIAHQPKWQLTPDQPKDGVYEIKEFAPAWWVTSFTPCLDQTVAASFGYLNLYLYMNEYNLNRTHYDLTYPILNKIEIAAARPDPEGKKAQVQCPDRFSVNLFLPHPAGDNDTSNNPVSGAHDSVTTLEERRPRRRFVKRYEDTITHDSDILCNRQAGLLAIQLAMDGRKFDPNAYYCALYDTGKSGKNGFEVWFDDFKE